MSSPSNTALPFYRAFLCDEFQRRLERNSRYSIRAFAQAIAIQPSALSQILAGKRTVSVRVLKRLLTAFEVSAEERARFVSSVIEEKSARGIRKVDGALRQLAKDTASAALLAVGNPTVGGARSLREEEFRLVADWYHFAILEMTYKKDFRPEARWIAARLGIGHMQAKLAVERLRDLGLLEESAGRWRKVRSVLDTKDKTKTSASHRARQFQILEKSRFSLENDPITERNHTGVTFCADPARIAVAKEKIQKFLWELTAFLEGENPSRIYEINVQLFPLERKKS